jgi:predicted nucleic acid-binding protein
MSRVFADTHFYIALLSVRDADHDRAGRFLDQTEVTQVVTTVGVLLELADGMAGANARERCSLFIEQLRTSPTTKIVSMSDDLLERGLSLYRDRPDKEWSLTDCISFVVMGQENLREAPTGDRHFEQAGFTPLFA